MIQNLEARQRLARRLRGRDRRGRRCDSRTSVLALLEVVLHRCRGARVGWMAFLAGCWQRERHVGGRDMCGFAVCGFCGVGEGRGWHKGVGAGAEGGRRDAVQEAVADAAAQATVRADVDSHGAKGVRGAVVDVELEVAAGAGAHDVWEDGLAAGGQQALLAAHDVVVLRDDATGGGGPAGHVDVEHVVCVGGGEQRRPLHGEAQRLEDAVSGLRGLGLERHVLHGALGLQLQVLVAVHAALRGPYVQLHAAAAARVQLRENALVVRMQEAVLVSGRRERLAVDAYNVVEE